VSSFGGGAVSNFAWKFSCIANSLRNDKICRKFVRDMNCSIQRALHDYECFPVVRLSVQVLTVLEVLELPLCYRRAGHLLFDFDKQSGYR
jgi:hypothetical protein